MALSKQIFLISFYFKIQIIFSALTFDESSLKLPKPINYAAYATSNDIIYIFGGLSNVLQTFIYISPPERQSSIFKWDMNAIGSITSLSATTQFPFYCSTQCTAITITNPNYIYIFGVKDEYEFGKDGTILIFDISTEQFLSKTIDIIPKMPFPQTDTCIVYNYDDNDIYLIGGQQNPNYMQSINMNNASNQTWNIQILPFFKEDIQCTYFNDYIYIFGGYDYNISTVSNEIWKYNINTSEWQQIITNLVYPTRYANVIIPKDIDLFYIIGGATTDRTLDIVQIFNPWTETIGISYINEGRIAPMSSFNIIKQRIYVFGGSLDNKDWSDSIEYTSSILNENDIFTKPPSSNPTTIYPTINPIQPSISGHVTITTVDQHEKDDNDNDINNDNDNDKEIIYIVIIVILICLLLFIIVFAYYRGKNNNKADKNNKQELDENKKYKKVEMNTKTNIVNQQQEGVDHGQH